MKHPGAALVTDYAHTRVITLSRPGALNAMSLPMACDLYRHYITAPHSDPDATVIIQGEGTKSFCAGGDIMALTANINGHNDDFYWCEYTVNHHIGAMKNTQVSLWNGHVLGSGVGVSIHGRFRVACESTRFAMPETQIGFSPDVGTSWCFSRIPISGLGAYMAITGNALRGADTLHAGLATHYVLASDFPSLAKDLCETRTVNDVEECLMSASAPVPACTLASNLPLIKKAFTVTKDTILTDIIRILKEDGSPFAQMTLDTMNACSPLAMSMALENLKLQKHYTSLLQALQTDFNAIQYEGIQKEFAIGVDARMIRKTNEPQWVVRSVEDVNLEEIKAALRGDGNLFNPHNRSKYPG